MLTLERNPNKLKQTAHWRSYKRMLIREYNAPISDDHWKIIRAAWNHGYWTCYDAHYAKFEAIEKVLKWTNSQSAKLS